MSETTTPFTKQQGEKLVSFLYPLTNIRDAQQIEDKHIYAIQILKQITHLPSQICTTAQIDCFLHIARTFLDQLDPSDSLYFSAYTSSMQLLTHCGVNEPKHSQSVCDFLITEAQKLVDDADNLVPIQIQTVFNGLADIAISYPALDSRIVDLMTNVLINEIPLTSANEIVQNNILTSLCRILKSRLTMNGDLALVKGVFTAFYTPFYLAHKKYVKFHSQTGPERVARSSSLDALRLTDRYVDALVGACRNLSGNTSGSGTSFAALRSMPCISVKKIQESEELLLVLVKMIGKIFLSLNDIQVSELIVPRLLGRIYFPPTPVDALIIEQLVELCILGQESAYYVIIVEFLNIFRRILKDSNNIGDTTIIDALTNLSKKVPPSQINIRTHLTKRVGRMFVDLGKEVRETTLSSSLIQGMGYLLPILSELVVTYPTIHEPITDSESNAARAFRTIWYFCVLFGFVEPNRWRSDWFEATRRLSEFVPPFISCKMVLSQIELECSSLLQSGGFSKDFHEHQKALEKYLPEKIHIIKQLNHAQLLYLLSAYHLETLRATTGTFHKCLTYAENLPKNYPMSAQLLDCFQGIADRAFVIFVEWLQEQPDIEKYLNIEIEALLLKCCSVSNVTRKRARNSVFILAKKFPQITWNLNYIFMLFDLVEAVGSTHASLLEGAVTLPKTHRTLELPDGIAARHLLFNDLVSLTSEYICLGLHNAPVQTHCVIQEYINSFNQLRQEGIFPFHHLGLSLAIRLSSTGTLSPSETDLCHVPVQNANYINYAGIQGFYMGEVRGMTKLLGDLQGQEYDTKKIEQLMVDKFKGIITNARRGLPTPDFNDHIYRAAAFAIYQDMPSNDLIHLISWAPALIFSQDSMQIGVNIWAWFIAARPELSSQLMAEISEAWNWTILQRMGLFTVSTRGPGPTATRCWEGSTIENVRPGLNYDDDEPHAVWIEFLSDRFLVVRESSPLEMKLIWNMLQSAVEDPKNLSALGSSLVTRFRLIRLCLELLKWAKESLVPEVLFHYQLLRERTYVAAVHWFMAEPVWYSDPQDHEVVVENVAVLTQVCELLEEETRLDGSFEAGSISSEYFKHSESTLEKMRKLLILLVGNEVDRIVAWTNPLGLPQLDVPGQDQYSSRNMKHWAEYFETAWAISPKLCLHLKSRFPNSRLLHHILERKVKLEAHRLLHYPEALPFLLTQPNIDENIPELKYLLYWEHVDPSTALNLLLHKSHALVQNYAVRSLRSNPPSIMSYYIPQLVQGIRTDTTGAVFNYLMDVASQSEFLAHQLLWNLQTYTEAPEETIFRKQARKLFQTIVDSMTDEQFIHFQKEFRFFDRITNISSLLLERGKTREERKPVLISELENIKVNDAGIYLPTDPDIVVHGIETSHSTVLQSAQKAPILVSFECHYREDEVCLLWRCKGKMEKIEEEEEEEKYPKNVLNSSSEEKMNYQISWTKSMRQSLIFKTGDDIRQDMLAVQLMKLFQRIFQHAGLDLFLYPYKVITTKPGCGMIEMVPNTLSRDQIGKKIEGTLLDYFYQKYGPPNTESFQRARKNFLQSMAGYAVVSFILQVKDRHNGNILLDEDGHIIHIDFGFIFDTSPGGDFGFEVAPFKLSTEMIQLMGGSEAETFKWFLSNGVKAYLAVRQYSDVILTLVEYMLGTQLPCFKVNTMERLRGRLIPDESERSAARFFTRTMMNSFSKLASFTTFSYDQFQKLTQRIEC